MQIIPQGGTPNESSFLTKLALDLLNQDENVYDNDDSYSPIRTDTHTIQVKRLALMKTPSNIDPSFWVTPNTAKKLQQF